MSDNRAYAEWVIARGGGIITTGGHLGVFVSAKENHFRCPPGWVFVDIADTDVDQLCEAIEVSAAGRKRWPKDARTEEKQDEAAGKKQTRK